MTINRRSFVNIRSAIRIGRLLSDERRAQIKANFFKCGQAIRNTVDVAKDVVGVIP